MFKLILLYASLSVLLWPRFSFAQRLNYELFWPTTVYPDTRLQQSGVIASLSWEQIGSAPSDGRYKPLVSSLIIAARRIASEVHAPIDSTATTALMSAVGSSVPSLMRSLDGIEFVTNCTIVDVTNGVMGYRGTDPMPGRVYLFIARLPWSCDPVYSDEDMAEIAGARRTCDAGVASINQQWAGMQRGSMMPLPIPIVQGYRKRISDIEAHRDALISLVDLKAHSRIPANILYGFSDDPAVGSWHRGDVRVVHGVVQRAGAFIYRAFDGSNIYFDDARRSEVANAMVAIEFVAKIYIEPVPSAIPGSAGAVAEFPAIEAAKEACLAHLRDRDDYRLALAAVASAQQARDSASEDQIAQAASALLLARQKLHKIENDALDADAGVISARKSFVSSASTQPSP